MTPGDQSGPRAPEAENPTSADQAHAGESTATPRRKSAVPPRAKSARTRESAEDVLYRRGYTIESASRRPRVVPADPAVPSKCLCGEPADFVVETNWSGGRHSRDPVCGSHVDEVVAAIRKAQARLNGS